MNAMRIDAEWIGRLPVVAALMARETFDSVATVGLADWSELDEATRWCNLRWQEAGHGYRRISIVRTETARIEFADMTDAVEFKLRFG